MTVAFKEQDNCLHIFFNGKEELVIPAQDKFPFYEKYIDEDINMKQELALKIVELDAETIPAGLQFYCDPERRDFEHVSYFQLKKSDESIQVSLCLMFFLEKWCQPMAPKKFIDLFGEQLSKQGYDVEQQEDTEYVGLDVSFSFQKGKVSKRIETEIVKVKEEYELLSAKLLKKSPEEAFIKIFHFPKEYKTTCAQYLLWFEEFLSYQGIESDVSIENLDGKTIFSVSPKDGTEVLEQIEKLFYQYMSLPYSRRRTESTQQGDLSKNAFHQLLAVQVEHFKTQLEKKECDLSFTLLDSMSGKHELEQFDGKLSLATKPLMF